MNNLKKFLILGSQRSGTTLLGMSLEAHRDIELIEENDDRFHFKYALTKRLNIDRLTGYKPTKKNEVVGFKSPRDSHRIDEISSIQGIKILWIYRDVYQVVSSMTTPMSSSGKSWAEMHSYNELIKYLYEGDFDYLVSKQLSWIESNLSSSQRTIGLACLCWIVKRQCERTLLSVIKDSMLSVNYDDLVSSPEETLSAILNFLQLSWDKNVLSHSTFIEGSRPGGAVVERTIDMSSLKKWESKLSAADINLIKDLVCEHQDR